MITRIMPRSGSLLIFVAAMLWASDGPFRVELLKVMPAPLLVLGEHLIDVLIVLPFLLVRLSSLRRVTVREWCALLVIGAGGSAVATLAFTAAFSYVSPSVAVLLQKLQPLIALLLAGALLGERRPSAFWPVALLAIVGAYCISFPHLVPRLFEGEQLTPNAVGVALALLAAALWAASTVLGKYALARIDAQLVMMLRFVIAFVVLAAINLRAGTLPQLALLAPSHWLLLLVVACTSGIVSLWLYYRGLTTTSASVATLAELGYPLAAVLVNAVVLGAALTRTQVLGMIVLLVAVLLLARVRVHTGSSSSQQ